MQVRPSALRPDEVAQRWRDLAQRRRVHFLELHESGRWRLYYSEADFIQRLQEVIQAAEEWEKLAAPRSLAGSEKN